MFWLGQCQVWSCNRAAQVMSILKTWVLKCASVLCPYIPRELVMVEGGVDEVKQSEPCFQHAVKLLHQRVGRYVLCQMWMSLLPPRAARES